jgi:hypothetical protein
MFEIFNVQNMIFYQINIKLNEEKYHAKNSTSIKKKQILAYQS